MNVQSNALPSVALIHSAHWTDDQLAVWSTVSWRAVFTGVVIALAVQLLLSLLGAGIGFTLVSNTDPATAEHAGRAALGVGLWWIVTSVLAVFIGAWCASELSPPGTERSGALQGVVVWAVSTLAGVLLAGTLASGVAAHAYSLAGVSHAGIGMGRSFDGLARAPVLTPDRQSGAAMAAAPTDDQQRAHAEAAAKASARASFILFVGGVLGLIAAAYGGTHQRLDRVKRYERHVSLRADSMRP